MPIERTSMQKDWSVLAQERVYHNPPWLTLYEQKIQLPSGLVIPDYLVASIPNVAMVFPLTAEGYVVLVEQYKHGVEKRVWDLPAGYMEPGEEPLKAAQRELEEETGYVGASWETLSTTTLDANRCASRLYLFLARDLQPTGLRQLDDTEEIQCHLVPLDEIAALVESSTITSGHSALGVLAALRRLNR